MENFQQLMYRILPKQFGYYNISFIGLKWVLEVVPKQSP